ncbi:hypothetical protein CYLTODRAFT_421271 [Cylindrobasidium torrendii FP15055 ss-10]|uniref:HSF-type DNA-binding domain-containing protein n=1 Tax=Cylindrobasidium torrendii FP15055 ss-10 TaxID=1314674 RepID=A0A0D7BE60_9AGAR|nr:hypothetical protein CYLTODRAFT_421271 [Cylindrobasidium torrendii FP15055 ss-10]
MAGSKLASSSRVRFPFQLWEMVNDEDTNDIISWSEDGMSLCIHDEKRLAEEVIPRWMKTEKAAAFVRQLNGYGFRKITNLQQGSMHRDHEAEVLRYAHPNFFRGGEAQVERIHLTKKPKEKKAVTSSSDSSAAADDTAVTLADIQHRQMGIIQDLSTLKESEGRLWDEALKSQAQQQKQQRMLCVILRFLGTMQPQLEKEARQPGWPPTQAQGQRLMLEAPKADVGDVSITEVDDEPGEGTIPFSSLPTFDYSQLRDFRVPSTGADGVQAETPTNDANLMSAFMDPEVEAYINSLADPSSQLHDSNSYGTQLQQHVNSASVNLDDFLGLLDADTMRPLNDSNKPEALGTAPSLPESGEKRKLSSMGDDMGPAHKRQKI